MAMTDRCWRKTIANPSASNAREFYPTDNGSSLTEDFVVPSQVSVFQVTIPEGKFDANSGDFVLGIFKTRANYMFSQRRVDIGDLLATQVKREIESKVKEEAEKSTPKGHPVVGYR